MTIYKRLSEEEFDKISKLSQASNRKKERAYKYCVLGKSFIDIASEDNIHHRTARKDVAAFFTRNAPIDYA